MLTLVLSSNSSFAQDEEEEFWINQLDTIVENVDPVKKPVISIGTGIMSFWGDVQNSVNSPIIGNFGFKVNGSALVGKKRNFKVNAFAIYGKLSGHDFNISRQMQLQPLPVDDNNDAIFPNSSFQTESFQIGLSFEYGFGHLIKKKKFNPFIAVGLSTMFFSPKGNLEIGSNIPKTYYHFWSDGTIRNFSESGPDAYRARITPFDKSYETDLSSIDLFDQGSFSQRTFTIPVDFGFDFYLSDRVTFRVGTSVNYSFTDMIDNYNEKIAKQKSYPVKNGYNDIFAFTYFTINLDLFSDPNAFLVERLFAEVGDYDYQIFFADQDEDQVLDRLDLCPDTPAGVAVNDSTGCPYDTDNDGIYDYMDIETGTPEGATVDEQGAQLTDDALAAMFDNVNAVSRKEIRLIPLANIWTATRTFTPGIIPDKFRKVDSDADGYISFQELLKTIDDYFDEKSTFKPEEIYELNDYFFTQ